MSGAIDFTELKQHVGIERAVELLGVNLKKAGAQLRGPCPVCKDGGDRDGTSHLRKGVGREPHVDGGGGDGRHPAGGEDRGLVGLRGSGCRERRAPFKSSNAAMWD